MIARSDILAERAGRRLQLPARPYAVPARPRAEAAPATGLDERVVMLIVGLALVACAAVIFGLPGFVETASAQPARVATLAALTLALQMFSVKVYGRGASASRPSGSSRVPSSSTPARRWRSPYSPPAPSRCGAAASCTRPSSTRRTMRFLQPLLHSFTRPWGTIGHSSRQCWLERCTRQSTLGCFALP